MDDYISREAALKTQERMCFGCPCDRSLCGKCAVITFKKQLIVIPADDVIPIEWIEAQVDKGKWAELIQRWREQNG